MAESIALIILWVMVCLIGLWASLRFLPPLIRFFWSEFHRAKEKIIDSDEETMVIKVKKESKKEKSDG